MRAEFRWTIAVVTAFGVGIIGAGAYAQIATPYYRAVTSVIAAMHPWRVTDIRVTKDDTGPGTVLLLTGEVRVHRGDVGPAAIVIGHVQTGAVIETPMVFWTLLLMWPARSASQRWARIAVGIPIFLVLEAATTPCQLMYVLARASAMLAGENNPSTAWERWSGFLEAGGRFALEVAAALITIALLARGPQTLLPGALAGRRS